MTDLEKELEHLRWQYKNNKELIKEYNKIIEEKKEANKQISLELLNFNLKSILPIETYYSEQGNIWFKYSVKDCKEFDCFSQFVFSKFFFLTNLNGNFINDKNYYEGYPCQLGWSVGAHYCRDEISAINKYESIKKITSFGT